MLWCGVALLACFMLCVRRLFVRGECAFEVVDVCVVVSFEAVCVCCVVCVEVVFVVWCVRCLCRVTL